MRGHGLVRGGDCGQVSVCMYDSVCVITCGGHS
jgi:hypothetical protein